MANKRDYCMARLAAARSNLQTSIEALDGCVDFFMDTDEDNEGDNRREAMDIALDAAGEGSRSIEQAQAMFDKMSAKGILEGEPEPDEDEGEAA